MATDNILAGLLGLSEGFRDVFVPYELNKAKQKAASSNLEKELSLRRQSKLQEERESLPIYEEKLGLQKKSDLESIQKKRDITDPLDITKRRTEEQEKSDIEFERESSLLDIKNQEKQYTLEEFGLPKDTEGLKPGVKYPQSALQAASSRNTKDVNIGLRKDQQLDRLEQNYRSTIAKAFTNRAGPLGTQSAKVDQAIHARTLMDQYYDKNTGDFNVPKAQYAEIGMSLANLISGTGGVTEGARNEILTRSASGDIAGMYGYITGETPPASTQEIFKNMSDSIDRQGAVSEDLKNGHFSRLKKLRPTGLPDERAKYIEDSEVGNSFKDYLKESLDKRKKSSTSPPGVNAPSNWTSDKESRYQELLKKKQGEQ